MTPTDRRTLLHAVGLGTVAAGATALTGCSPTSSGTPAAPVAVPTKNIAVGGGLVLTEGKYVITQPTKGEFKAFDKQCPHQGCPVTKVETNGIVCVCHNSRFALDDGRRLTGPATSGLTPAKATVQGDDVVITPS